MARYCPNCQKNVVTDREDIDVGLALFLFCCTGTIGFWIYLIVYFSRPEDRCVFCDGKTEAFRPHHYQGNAIPPPSGQQWQNNSYVAPPRPYKPVKSKEQQVKIDENTGMPIDSKLKRFCPMCGAEFSPGTKFCSSCGSDLRNVK